MADMGTKAIAFARTDADDRLIAVEGPLAELNRSCGGNVGATLAVPELLALVTKAREYGFKLSRQFTAVEGSDRIVGWVDISPLPASDGGCEISVNGWDRRSLPAESQSEAILRRLEVARHLAECSARLDPSQHVLSIETDAPDLAQFAEAVKGDPTSPWTKFVDLEGLTPGQATNWQLLDGRQCTIAGSKRKWTVSLEPLGQPNPGSAGYALYLSAAEPLLASSSEDRQPPSLGRELTPVLRQPVNRIIANAETIRTRLAGPLRQEYSDYAADIASAGQHLLGLIDDLADLEVVEAEGFSTAPDRIDLADVAQRACGILGVRAKEKGIALEPPAEGESQPAIAEFRRVLQVLLNLIGNAIRYSPDNSRIWVRLDAIGDTATVTVADQGLGLDQAQQSKVFEKFERLGRGDDGGSGLGLYISRRIARAMGGDLTVESAPGQGARFTLSVPAGQPEKD